MPSSTLLQPTISSTTQRTPATSLYSPNHPYRSKSTKHYPSITQKKKFHINKKYPDLIKQQDIEAIM
ncbi:hypothetical protein PRUPE_2G176700 [Prunus persica]|uniref:Uncharacterized protein n=1 Tax=Prunus persica TaxID=3760 RepID=A0A251QHC6_PRUPE|nr:hypothetical protein PRUPE_2G176700 [Prunus persica]